MRVVLGPDRADGRPERLDGRVVHRRQDRDDRRGHSPTPGLPRVLHRPRAPHRLPRHAAPCLADHYRHALPRIVRRTRLSGETTRTDPPAGRQPELGHVVLRLGQLARHDRLLPTGGAELRLRADGVVPHRQDLAAQRRDLLDERTLLEQECDTALLRLAHLRQDVRRLQLGSCHRSARRGRLDSEHVLVVEAVRLRADPSTSSAGRSSASSWTSDESGSTTVDRSRVTCSPASTTSPGSRLP